MGRKVVSIDSKKCIGCGLCVNACHEKAIKLVDGKAKVVRIDYCDGLGNCLPHCPVDAIKIVDEETLAKVETNDVNRKQWPIQIKLISTNASFFDNADILVAASCTAFSYPEYQKILGNKVLLIGCPKLDGVDYSNKLSEIFTFNNIKSVTVLRMEVPCCGGLEREVKIAIAMSGKNIDLTTKTVSITGELI